MPILETIQKPIERELKLFDKRLKENVEGESQNIILQAAIKHVLKSKGKQLRPLFVLLSAKICGEINDSTYNGASLVELLHTASLVHDDVVDDANKRRGFFAINALWKNKAAVLIGDFLLAKGMLLSVKHKEYRLLEIVSNAVQQMSEGELLQMEKARRMDISEGLYYDVIRKKTASLMASCCACGAASVGADDEKVEIMRQVGETIGLAFQIQDDIFDFGDSDTGKPKGTDIKEKKITLPLIYALNQTSYLEKRRIISLIKRHHNDDKKISEVALFVRQNTGLDYAQKKMNELVQHAKQLLQPFPESEAKQSFLSLIDYCVTRTK